MPIKNVKMKISKNKKMRFFLMSQGSLNPKIRFLGQKVWPVARSHTDRHTDRQTEWLLRAPFQGFRISFLITGPITDDLIFLLFSLLLYVLVCWNEGFVLHYLAQNLWFWTGIIFIRVYVSVCVCVCLSVCESLYRLSQKVLDRFQWNLARWFIMIMGRHLSKMS